MLLNVERLDLLCVGYLADAQVLRVDHYPQVNRGTTVNDRCRSVAGDAPIVALLAVQQDLAAGLITNPVGDDAEGRRLLAWLHDEQVRTSVSVQEGSRTPHLTVVSDSSGDRTWFAWVEHAFTGLDNLDLRSATRARIVYLDCYQVIDDAAATAAASVAALGIPMVLNLGGDPLSATVADAVAGASIAMVQTSLDDHDVGQAEQTAAELHQMLAPEAAVVTLGRHGAVAHTDAGVYRVRAEDIRPLHTHGAGAAFSAGYLTALLGGAAVPTALQAGCRAGTAHCAQWPHPSIPRRAVSITHLTATEETDHG